MRTTGITEGLSGFKSVIISPGPVVPFKVMNRTIGVNFKNLLEYFSQKSVVKWKHFLYNVEKNLILDLQRGVSNANFTTGS